MNALHTDDGRTTYEQSPSCGSFETARAMHAPEAHDAEEIHERDEERIDDLSMDTDSFSPRTLEVSL